MLSIRVCVQMSVRIYCNTFPHSILMWANSKFFRDIAWFPFLFAKILTIKTVCTTFSHGSFQFLAVQQILSTKWRERYKIMLLQCRLRHLLCSLDQWEAKSFLCPVPWTEERKTVGRILRGISWIERKRGKKKQTFGRFRINWGDYLAPVKFQFSEQNVGKKSSKLPRNHQFPTVPTSSPGCACSREKRAPCIDLGRILKKNNIQYYCEGKLKILRTPRAQVELVWYSGLEGFIYDLSKL